MTKKILKISAFILIILAIALFAYYFILKTNDNVASGKKPFFGNIFPFGNEKSTEETPFIPTEPEITPEEQIQSFEQIVRLISDEPVAGSTFIPNTKGDIIRYIEKATGHIFDVPSYENSRTSISKNTIPKIYKAKFTENGNGFIAQYLKEENLIETLYGKLVGDDTEKKVEGTILNKNIIDFAISPNTSSLFTLEKSASGSEGFISSPNGNNKKRMWVSELRELIPQFTSTNKISINTKSHPTSLGILYSVNTINTNTNILVSNQYGLTSLVNGSKPYVAYLNNSDFIAQNTDTKTNTVLSPKTFPEKCVWSQAKLILYCAVSRSNINAYSLYNWYQGKITLSDDIWSYDIENNTSDFIVNLSAEAGRTIDISNISINQSDTYLLIENKIDDSLWTVKINP